MVAAVVRPRIAPWRVRMMPAPRKPMPDTICEATRDGSKRVMPSARTSWKPYLDTRTMSAAVSPTMACVRMPALFPRIWRSSPIRVDSTSASTIHAISVR